MHAAQPSHGHPSLCCTRQAVGRRVEDSDRKTFLDGQTVTARPTTGLLLGFPSRHGRFDGRGSDGAHESSPGSPSQQASTLSAGLGAFSAGRKGASKGGDGNNTSDQSQEAGGIEKTTPKRSRVDSKRNRREMLQSSIMVGRSIWQSVKRGTIYESSIRARQHEM